MSGSEVPAGNRFDQSRRHRAAEAKAKQITSGVETRLTQIVDDPFRKAKDNVDAGTRIGKQDGNVHYDFSGGGVAEMPMQYLGRGLLN